LVALGILFRDRLYASPLLLHLYTWTGGIGFFAVLAGWTTTEVGRQPWTVYGLLRTSQSVTPSLSGVDVLISLAVYVLAYLFIYPSGLWLMARLIKAGPGTIPNAKVEAGRPSAPVRSPPEGTA
jgi:cytochrome bd ubiquinol oxidase subunit I